MRISSIAPFVSAAALPAFAQGEVRSGMNAFATYTVKHIQTLLPNSASWATELCSSTKIEVRNER